MRFNYKSKSKKHLTAKDLGFEMHSNRSKIKI
jgi:hypothetical protein